MCIINKKRLKDYSINNSFYNEISFVDSFKMTIVDLCVLK